MNARRSFDRDTVKVEAALYGWARVIQDATGHAIPNGKGNHPCPLCEGTDRFHVRRDFKKTGSVHCRHCHNKNNGDGFAFIMKAMGWDFFQTLKAVAQIVGCKPDESRSDYGPRFTECDWNDQLFKLWQLKYPGISDQALRKAGGIMGMHREQKCLIFPVLDSAGETVNHLAMTLQGHFTFEGGKQGNKKIIGGRGNGFSGFVPDNCRLLIKVEGYPDMLALLSTDLPSDVGVVTNAFGAGDVKPGLIETMASKADEIWIVHDRDVGGQAGALRFAATFAKFKPTKNVALPFPIQEKSGKDLRDWLSDGRSFQELEKLASDVEPASACELPETEAEEPIKLAGIYDFVTKNPNMREPMIEGLLRRGETANVIASTKVGKSWLSADLAMSIAAGTKWLKTYETTQGVVVFIDLELHPETFAKRLKDIANFRGHDLKKLNETFIPVCLRGTGHNIDSLERVINQIEGNVDLIVLDAWYRLIPEGVKENDNAQMMAMYNRLDAYAKQCNAAIVVIHHSSKGEQGTKRVTDVGSGAGSISRAADTHIVIREHAEDGLSVLNAACRSFPPVEPISMFFTWPCWHVSQTEVALKSRTSQSDVRREAADAKAIEKIKTFYKVDSTFSANDVRNVIGAGKDRCVRILNEFTDEFEPAGVREPARKDAGPQPLFRLKTM